MARLQALLTTVVLALALSSSAVSVPAVEVAHEHSSTHSVRTVNRRGLQIESYQPPSSFETFGEGIVQSESARLLATDPEAQARQFVAEKLKVNRENVRYRSGFKNGAIRHSYVRQEINGIPFANAVANVAWKDDKVVSFGSSFVKPSKIAAPKPTVELEKFLPQVEEMLEGKYNGHPTSLEYLARPDGSAALTYVAQIQNEEENKWYEAFIDAHTGELVSVTDFTAEASYRVLPINKKIITEGLELLSNPQDTIASPNGWHASGTTLNTSGNNVVAYESSTSTGLTSQSAANAFDYTYNTSAAPSSSLAAATTNAFYVINSIHDFAYRYGFTEAAFNFQNDNLGKGGRASDRVQISVQDSSGTNNANFATPPDGQVGQCRMYIWTSTTPNRDGSLENDIIVHEMTHGITNRLTGGGTARCLQTTEAGGMGEGWSDAMSEWAQQKSATIRDYVLGDYVTNNPAGIRTKPYSTSTTVNNYTYASVRGLTSVHRVGEIWANILHNVYAALVAQYGWSSTARTNPDGAEGNIVYLHLFLDALALQPCNPTFPTARAAWIQADANRYGGANKCLLWKAFASRGLGPNASGYVDDKTVPSGC
ncbi:metalloprotease [Coprinopsis sp. MPI-PUGE-AT-0042]|nr:metalloprotease [Coprinopsis sp. MPI-PUGE-AT-0042]